LPKILLGAIIPDVRPPYLNSRPQKFANNGEQWDKQDDYGQAELKDYLAGGDFEDWNDESDWEE